MHTGVIGHLVAKRPAVNCTAATVQALAVGLQALAIALQPLCRRCAGAGNCVAATVQALCGRRWPCSLRAGYGKLQVCESCKRGAVAAARRCKGRCLCGVARL